MRIPASSDAPLVSVVLPTRNRATLLRKAVQSVRSQTWRGLEVLVVDDGSTDATPSALQEIAALDPRVRVVRFELQRGAAAARNHAISEARGSYVAFQDDDSIWVPDKIERMVGALEQSGPGTGFAYSAAASVELDGSGQILGVGLPSEKYRGPWLVGTYAVMVRREDLLQAGGFDEELPRLQDFDLWVRILARTGYVYLPEVFVRTVRVPGGISTRRDALARASARMKAKYRESPILTKEERAHLLHALGHKLMMEGFWWAGARNFVGAVRTDWRLGRSWLALGAASLGTSGYRAASAWRGKWLTRRATADGDGRLVDAAEQAGRAAGHGPDCPP